MFFLEGLLQTLPHAPTPAESDGGAPTQLRFARAPRA